MSGPPAGRVAGPRAGRPEASAAIWRWQEPRSATPESPGRARLTGVAQAFVGACVGALVYGFVSPVAGGAVLCIAGAIALAALVSPLGLYRLVQGAFASLGRQVGRALTWLMLVPVFYLFFLPYGRLMRRGRRDRLQRFFEPDAGSYWQPHEPLSAADHERQF